MLRRVISGGQTGADRAGLLAARQCNIATGGWAPRGWRTERGPEPGLENFGLVEHPRRDWGPRTRQNVADADGTVIFAKYPVSGGSRLTANLCLELRKPWYGVVQLDAETAFGLLQWLRREAIEVLNVAGNRESKWPGIESMATKWLVRVFTEATAVPGDK